MPISQYLQQKYPFFPNAPMPIEMLCDELQLTAIETKQLVKAFLEKRSCPRVITFAVFVSVCSEYLNR